MTKNFSFRADFSGLQLMIHAYEQEGGLEVEIEIVGGILEDPEKLFFRTDSKTEINLLDWCRARATEQHGVC